MCGEQPSPFPWLHLMSGSPPRVRGTEEETGFWHYEWGITPACAGNRAALRCLLFVDRDHPRVCGEQEISQAILRLFLGSPPRVRGTAWSP